MSYHDYFALRENPFSITPDPRFLYLSDNHRTALEHLESAATPGVSGFVLLTGDVGTGKTTMCRAFLEKLPPRTEVALILNPVLTLNEFLQAICDELDLVIEGSRRSNKNLVDHLNRFLLQVYAVGQKTILIVDEAQNLSEELLEQIRLLTNLETATDKLLQIYLIGQPELRDMLNRPEMAQVSQRITSRFHLGPLSKAQTRAYIETRLAIAGAEYIKFTRSAIQCVYAYTKGTPRLINVLCDKALQSAYLLSAEKIDGKVVRHAQQRLHGEGLHSRWHPGRLATAGSAAVAAVAAATFLAISYLPGVSDLNQTGSTTESAVVASSAAASATSSAEGRDQNDQLRSATEAEAGRTAGNQASALPGKPDLPATSAAAVQDTKPIPADSPSRQTTVAAATQTALPGRSRADASPGRPAVPRHVSAGQADGQSASGDTAGESAEVTEGHQLSKVATVTRSESHGDAAAQQAAQTAKQPVPRKAESSLARHSRQYAEDKLREMWGIKEPRSGGLSFCQDAALHNLHCFRTGGGLAGLAKYNRPAILYLNIADVPAYALMLRMGNGRVALDVLGKEHILATESLARVWNGGFRILWRRPPNIAGNITFGTSGIEAIWLRRAMDRIEGGQSTGDVYNEQLVTRVKRFQRESGLAPDGIVGPRTFIMLQNKLAELES